MEVSSTSMKVAMETMMAMNQGLMVRRGAARAGVAEDESERSDTRAPGGVVSN